MSKLMPMRSTTTTQCSLSALKNLANLKQDFLNKVLMLATGFLVLLQGPTSANSSIQETNGSQKQETVVSYFNDSCTKCSDRNQYPLGNKNLLALSEHGLRSQSALESAVSDSWQNKLFNVDQKDFIDVDGDGIVDHRGSEYKKTGEIQRGTHRQKRNLESFSSTTVEKDFGNFGEMGSGKRMQNKYKGNMGQ